MEIFNNERSAMTKTYTNPIVPRSVILIKMIV